MTGTGTQEDPYVVDNWNDFVTAVGQYDAYVTCPEGLVFDMNEIAPDGINGIIINCKWLDGHGLTIKKLYNTRNHDYYGFITTGRPSTICNVNIESFESLGTMIMNDKGNLTVYNCIFSGIMQNRFLLTGQSTAVKYGSTTVHLI